MNSDRELQYHVQVLRSGFGWHTVDSFWSPINAKAAYAYLVDSCVKRCRLLAPGYQILSHN